LRSTTRHSRATTWRLTTPNTSSRAPGMRAMARREPSALVDDHVDLVFRARVVGAGTDDLAVLALLDHVRAPAGGTRDHEQRREHRRRHAHHVVRTGREPVEVREHLLDLPITFSMRSDTSNSTGLPPSAQSCRRW